jgi:hypothetical protein
MPLYRHTKLPPPPELGDKTWSQYLPRQSTRRALLLLLALGAVLFLKRSSGWSLGGLLEGPRTPAPAGDSPVYRIKVTRPEEPKPPRRVEADAP